MLFRSPAPPDNSAPSRVGRDPSPLTLRKRFSTAAWLWSRFCPRTPPPWRPARSPTSCSGPVPALGLKIPSRPGGRAAVQPAAEEPRVPPPARVWEVNGGRTQGRRAGRSQRAFRDGTAPFPPILTAPSPTSPPGSSVPGTLQAGMLERVAAPSSRGSYPPGMEPSFERRPVFGSPFVAAQN